MAEKNNFQKNIIEEKSLNEPVDVGYNRKQVDRIKRFLVGSFVLVCSLPVYLGLYTMVKMNSLQKRADTVDKSIHIELQDIDMVSPSDELRDELSRNYVMLDTGTEDSVDKVEIRDSENLMTAQNMIGEKMNDVVVSNGKRVYLTFDDGPSEHTAELLDVLAEYNVKATFFVVRNPDPSLWPMYERIVSEGHTLAMHSYSHVYNEIYDSKESFIDDVSKLREFLYDQTGIECDLYRFPGGSSNSVMGVDVQELISYLNDEGITYFDWNALSEDAVNPSLSAGELNANVMSYVRTNEGDSVVLMHDIDACGNTLEALPALIETLRKEGYTLRPIDGNTTPVQHIKYKCE